MKRHSHPLLWVILTAVVALNILVGNNAEVVTQSEQQVKNLTNKCLQTIPLSNSSSIVTTLVLDGNLIGLNGSDCLALVSYSALTQLHLDHNLVMEIGAKYFSGLPRLTVLSLSSNKISRLDPEAFSGLNNLKELDLSYNLLTSLPKQLLQGLKNLQVLKIQGNPWNCSCELLHSFREAQRNDFASSNAQCASPESMAKTDLIKATAQCYPTPTPPTGKEQTQVLGNSWKFTVCVAVLGLTTAALITCAIKGPSWYRLFHNYRHRRLHNGDDSERVGTTVFHQTERNHQIYTFEKEGRTRQTEEDEDEYFEEPYIRREEGCMAE